MKTYEALQVIESLADGVDPYTGEVFPDDSPYQNRQVVRALFKALRALEQPRERQQYERRLPENAGNPWNHAEDEMLCERFSAGTTIRQLAQGHERTEGAIQSRLKRLSKLRPY